MNSLAAGYFSAGKLDKALKLCEQTFELRKATLGPDHPDTLVTMNNLIVAYQSTDQLNKALPLMERKLELLKAKHGLNHPDTLADLRRLGEAYSESNQLDKALPVMEQVLEQTKASFGPNHPDTLGCMNGLAKIYWQKGDLLRSVPMFEEVLQAYEQTRGRSDSETQRSVANLGVNYKDAGRIEEAIPLLEEALASSKRFPNLSWVSTPLRDAYLKGKQTEKFAAVAVEELKVAKASLPAQSAELANSLIALGKDYLTLGENQQAAELLEEGYTIRKQIAPDLWNTFNSQSLLGGAILAEAQAISSAEEAEARGQLLAKAEPLLIEGYQGLKQRESMIPPQASNSLPEALDRLIMLYTTLEKPDEITKYTELRKQYPKLDQSNNGTGK